MALEHGADLPAGVDADHKLQPVRARCHRHRIRTRMGHALHLPFKVLPGFKGDCLGAAQAHLRGTRAVPYDRLDHRIQLPYGRAALRAQGHFEHQVRGGKTHTGQHHALGAHGLGKYCRVAAWQLTHRAALQLRQALAAFARAAVVGQLQAPGQTGVQHRLLRRQMHHLLAAIQCQCVHRFSLLLCLPFVRDRHSKLNTHGPYPDDPWDSKWRCSPRARQSPSLRSQKHVPVPSKWRACFRWYLV